MLREDVAKTLLSSIGLSFQKHLTDNFIHRCAIMCYLKQWEESSGILLTHKTKWDSCPVVKQASKGPQQNIDSTRWGPGM